MANTNAAIQPADDAYLELDGITVSFPGVRALDGVSLEVRAGEVHGLMGENGAGKSTLLKVLSGVNHPQAGTLRLNGSTHSFTTTRAAIDAGIAIIYQELHLVPELTVADNLMLGQLPNRLGVLDRRALIKRAVDELERLGEHVDPRTPVKHLSIGQRQMIEIGKALMRDARVIAFDEPTSSLSARETENLFRIIKALRAEGRAIIYVTHRMEEVDALCDRVTVFRDGKRIQTFESMANDRQALITAMVGRPIADVYGYRPRPAGDVLLEAKGLLGPGLAEPASFTARRGEIVGFFGLVGAGRSELMKLIYGAERASAGHVELAGKQVNFKSPRDAVRAGIALCPEDRKKEGIVAIASVADNLNLSARRHFCRGGFLLDATRERALTQDYIRKLAIKTRDGDTAIGTLSGGNQQKVILSRWLAERIEVFLMDEPTRGIDVGARAEIYHLLYELAEAGRSVLMVSSDLAEVIGVADRIIVMREGRIVGNVPKAEATPGELIKMALPR